RWMAWSQRLEGNDWLWGQGLNASEELRQIEDLSGTLDDFYLVKGCLKRGTNRDTAMIFQQGRLGLAHGHTDVVGKLPCGRHLIRNCWHLSQGHDSLGEQRRFKAVAIHR